jgi:Peptidyl-prolyl cis-trans isomerase (rotamase) - cyclophilin family
MRHSIKYILLGLAAAAMMTSCNNAAKKAEEAAAEQAKQDSIAAVQQAAKIKEAEERMATLEEEPVFSIVTNVGTIKVKLYSKTPKHRDNFEKLALTGYYNGLLFHRVIDGFMIQGGDPYTRDTSAAAVAKYGQGGPGYTIPAEFVPEYKHKKGALAAARRGDVANPKKESSGSQFYIVQNEKACAQLDGEYTVFGETVSGFDVIDRIAKMATNSRDLPLTEVRIKKVALDEGPKHIITKVSK